MAIQVYVSGEDFKKLIDDKLVNATSIKLIVKEKGILPVCASPDALSELIYRMFFGSGTMTQIHQVMNFEQNNLKSTMVVIKPKTIPVGMDFLTGLSDEFTRLQRIPSSKYVLKNICKDKEGLTLQYFYTKPQKGRLRLVDTKDVTLDVKITPLSDGQYKVNIRHEGISESKQFVSLLGDMVKPADEEQIFSLKRITLSSLQKAHKVDFFDNFGAYVHRDWSLVDVTNVTVNKNEKVVDEDIEYEATTEIGEDEPTGKLTGISSAILTGAGLRNNDFVKECMLQNFIFSSMRYKWRHKTLPTIIEIDVTFKQTDLKINITKTYKTEDDGIDYITTLPASEQDDYIDYFQNVAYSVYTDLLEAQRTQLVELGREV